ncbi:MAG: ribonuclease HIII [Methylacidiphilales bacterium]|nr:ribonuclease HIII [Candidatus Methylacidiphilales bacterium]
MTEPSSFTFKISPEQAGKLRAILEQKGFAFREVPYTLYGAQKEKLTVNAYTSGKLLVQGRGAKEFVEFTIEPEIVGEAKLGYDEIHNPEMFQPHLGIDESGKGDFFGPLVIAGVFVNGDLPRKLLDLGVKDSKQITSDQKALDLADAIKDLVSLDRFNVIVISPEKYNALYLKFGNLNRLLAWGHATVIENLLTRWPDCPRALSDKFAHESLIQRALKEHGKKIVLQQRTKAESDIAVAAASILARAAFLTRLKSLGEKIGVALPKGASVQVKIAAKEIVKKAGPEGLQSVCKFHFKTYREVIEGDLLD